MVRWGLAIDLDRCTACQACVVACRIENNVVPAGSEARVVQERAIYWNQFFTELHGTYPDLLLHSFPRPCMHCENPPCVSVCPVDATYKDADGRVLVRYDRCIGCRYCMVACPYGARYFNWVARGDAFLEDGPNPDLVRDSEGWLVGPSPRPLGVVEKCTLCIQRIERAKEESLPLGSDLPGGVVTACAETCPAFAITFGDLDDPSSEVSRLARDKRSSRLLEELGTRPQVYYLAEG